MFENQNANNNSYSRNPFTDMMQRSRGSLPDGTLIPNEWRQSGRGNRSGNLLSVNQQNSAAMPSTPDTTATGVKPTTSVNPPSYLPPIQAKDSQGKTLPQYRMGIGHRILGTLANFANGFAGKGGQPIYVGPGALNNRYYQEEAQREKQNQENLDWWRTQHPDVKDSSVETKPSDSGTSQKDPSSEKSGSSSLFTPSYSARERFALSPSRALPAPNYRFTAFNPTTNQRIGSHDGKTWSDLPNSDPTRA